MRASRSLIEWFFFLSAALCGLLTLALFLLMFWFGLPLLGEGQTLQLFQGRWNPSQGQYSIYPMLVGSLSIALLAMLFSLPLSLGTSFLITTLAPKRLAGLLLDTIRLMSGIPTVIYGLVAVFLLVPIMRESLAKGNGMCILTAAMVLAILIAPTMIIFFVNALRSIPIHFILAADALGASKVDRLIHILLPQAWPGILTGILMGLGRALGDTMISLMLAGNALAMPQSVTDSARTLTAHIGLVIADDFESLEFRSIFACGMVLYIFTTIGAALARFLNQRLPTGS